MSLLSADKRILVTGGMGFLGLAVVRQLRQRGCQQIVIPRRATCDLTKPADVTRLFDKVRPNLVLHLAASDQLPEGEGAAEELRNNVLLSTNVIEAACRSGVVKTACMGCESSYPPDVPVPLREETMFDGLPEASRAAFGIAKRLAFVQAQAYRRQYGFHCIYLVPTNMYGPGDKFGADTNSMIASLIRKFVEGADTGAAQVVIGGTGSATRDFLHVNDCAEAVVLALEQYDGAEALNLGSGTELGIHELVRKIARLAGYSGQILWDASRPEGPRRRFLDVTRAERALGFRPRRLLQDGLHETVEWYRSNRARRSMDMKEKVIALRA
jgi:GDP-L-fucose synthase